MAVAPLAALGQLCPSLLGGRTLAGGDHLVYWYPLMQFFQTRVATDEIIPFWIPNLFGGMPLPESLGPSFLYPTDLLCWGAGVPVRLFYAWDTWLHLVIASLGIHVLVRRLGVHDAAAAFAACAYVFGGYLQVQIGAGTHVFIRAAGWLPWVFVAVIGAGDAAPRVRPVPLAVLFTLLALTQAFQILAYLALVVPVVVACRVREQPAGRQALAVACAILLAGALAAVVWLPGAAYFGHSFRHLASGAWSRMEFLRWPELVELVLPDLAEDGSRVKALGLIPVICAAVAWVAGWQRAVSWTALAGVALVFALGPQTPPGEWLGRLPLFRSFRVSSHWIVFVQLAVSVLAGLGLEAACNAKRFHGRLRTWAMAAGLIGLTLADAQRATRPHPRQRPAAALAAGTASILTLLPRATRTPFRVHSEEPHTLLNTRVADGLEWTTGYHGAVLEVFGRFFDAATACGRVEEAMAVLGARYFVTRRPSSSAGLVLVGSFSGQDGGVWWLSRCDRSLPRAFVPREVRADPDGTIAQRMLCAGRLATERIAWVHTALHDPPRVSADSVSVRVRPTSPNFVEAEVAVRGRSLVVFSEVAYPAWKGLVDDVRTPVLRADLVLRAVVVPPGRHVIRLVYDSLWFKLGLWISLLSWAALLATFLPAARATRVY